MTYPTAGSRVLNPLHTFEYPATDKLWWRDEAWNDDTIAWLATGVDPEEMGDRLACVEEDFLLGFSSLLLPEAKMSGEELASFYLTVGDIPDLDEYEEITLCKPTRFLGDASSPFSLPVQLVLYYLSTDPYKGVVSGREGRAVAFTNVRIRALLSTTRLTVEEWNHLHREGLMSEDMQGGENVFTRFSSSPGLHLLPPMENLAGQSPVDYLSTLLNSNLARLSKELEGEEPGEAIRQIKENLINVNRWIASYNRKPEHLVTLHESLASLAISLSVFYPEEEQSQTYEFHPVSRVLRLIRKLQLHPNFNGDPTSEGYDILIARFEEKKVRVIEEAATLPYPTLVGDITAPGSLRRMAPDVIAGRVGLVEVKKRNAHKYDADQIDDAPILHAILTYTPEQAEIIFRKLVLRPYQYQNWRLSVVLAPLFGQFFKELRARYGEDVPLEWILAAEAEPELNRA